MKFSEMPYARPDTEAVKKQLTELMERLKNAATYEEAKAAFLEEQKASLAVETQATLASIRHSIDTRDTFYDEEEKFWNTFSPELEEYQQAWKAAMLESKFRPEFTAEYGDLMFVNAEIARKCFTPEIIPEMQQENDLVQAYEKLLASAQIPFEGKTYTLSQLTPLKSDPDDARRLAAWQADAKWSMEHAAELDADIEKYAKGWRFERISLVASAIMRVAMYEMLYMADIPAGVAINEAVEIAKHYESPEVVKFINGILGSFARGELKE